MEDQKTVILTNGTKVVIELLPLKPYGEFIIVLKGTIKQIASEWAGASNEQILESLPSFIVEHVDEVAKIIEIGTRGQVTAAQVLGDDPSVKIGLADVIELVSEMIIVNDVKRIMGAVKKATAALKTKTPPNSSTLSPAPSQA